MGALSNSEGDKGKGRLALERPVEAWHLEWGTPHLTKSLRTLCQKAEYLAQERISWYRRKKEAKRRWSLALRIIALFVGIAGGMCPLLGGAVGGIRLERLGYALLGLAGGLVLFDKLFGLSSSWMRFMAAAQEIERLHDAFVMEWSESAIAYAEEDGRAEVTHSIELLRQFIDSVHMVVKQEMDAWIVEFQSNLTSLERSTRVGAAGKTLSP